MWQNGRYLGPHVNALARAGDALYLGGAFATVAGRAQQHLAAVDARTGAWRPGLPSVQGEVRALAVHGTTLYVGGDVFELGGRQVLSDALSPEIQAAVLGEKTPQQALDDAAATATSILKEQAGS